MESASSLVLFQLIALIFSVMVHEISHGLMAERLGDQTARLAGRITLNPLKHIDIFGSIILPLLLFLTHSPVVLGWAKPVPYNPNNLPNPKTAAGKIAAAGPLSNFLLAAVFGLMVRAGSMYGFPLDLLTLFAVIVIVNLSLGVFNLIPVPPLDGSKVLFAWLPASKTAYRIMDLLERYGIFIIFILLWLGGEMLAPIILRLFGWFTGQGV